MIRPLNRRERFGVELARTLRLMRPAMFWLVAIAAVASAPKIPLLIGFIAAGTTELKSDGKLQLASDGKLRLASGSNDNCCCSCWACASCTDTPPSAYILTFSGLTRCTSCVNCGGGSLQMTDGDPNATFTVPCNPVACNWAINGTDDVTFSYDTWSLNGCTGTKTSQIDRNSFVSVEQFTTGGVKKVRIVWFADVDIFRSGDAARSTCNDLAGYSYSNTVTTCSCGAGATGGTVDVDPA